MRELILSQKTIDEQAAGRKAIGDNAIREAIANQVLREGLARLKNKFKLVFGPAYLNWDKDTPKDDWEVDFTVRTNGSAWIPLTDKLLGFPNNQLIASLTLLEP
jgi:hypothetical protein